MPLCSLRTCLSPPLANKLLWEPLLLISLSIRKYLRPCFAYDNTQNGWQFKDIKAELWKVKTRPQGLWKAGPHGLPVLSTVSFAEGCQLQREARWERGLWGVKRGAVLVLILVLGLTIRGPWRSISRRHGGTAG